MEKNLASLGFFTPSNKNVRAMGTKTVTFTKIVDGKRQQAKATIIPGATFGLPTTADQDKYIALQKIVMDSKKHHGEVRNPITFSSAELLDLLGQCRNSGGNYKHIDEWLNVMTATTIISEGMIYLDGRPNPPELFETSRKKTIFSKQKQAREKELEIQVALELAYEDYRDQMLDGYIVENYPGEKYAALIDRKRQELSPKYRQFAFWKPEALTKFLESLVRSDLEKGLSLQPFDSFCKKRNLTGLTP